MNFADTGKILIVDDSDQVRSFLAALLREEGFTVVEACNGKEAEDYCKIDPALDLIITDIMMPDQEGLETIRGIRKKWPRIAVIAISGSGDQYLDIALRFGASAAFTKPVAGDEIISEVRRLLALQRERASST